MTEGKLTLCFFSLVPVEHKKTGFKFIQSFQKKTKVKENNFFDKDAV